MAIKQYTYDIPDHPIRHAKVDPNKLNFDPDAQRSLNKPRAQKIADNIVPTALGTILVSERADGAMYVIDGMHRTFACQLAIAAGTPGVHQISAEIHSALTKAEEASMFIIKNMESQKVSPKDEYRIGLTAGHPLFIDTEKIIKSHGLSMGNRSANQIRGIKGVLSIVQKFGDLFLDQALTVAEKAWGRTAESWDNVLLHGLAEFYYRHGHEMSDHNGTKVLTWTIPADALAVKLGKVGPAYAWRGKVHTSATGGNAHSDGTASRSKTAYRLFANEWNRGRRVNRIDVA
ncbi:DUF6551 family protein [Actinacidiphila glaucinigra]|uniref:DUF6551 family protein n=1 Tax=Actinacidiphila glaucinigra TaxID=235986 RepID=UPI003724580D